MSLVVNLLAGVSALVVAVGGGLVVALTGPLEKRQETLDPRKVNEIELELGLSLSNYGDTTIDVISHASSEVIRENQKVIDKLDEVLNPIDHCAKRIASAYAIPTHLMSGCPCCGRGDFNERGRCTICDFEHPKGGAPTPEKPGGCRTCQRLALDCRLDIAAGRADALKAKHEEIRQQLIQPMDEPYPVEVISPRW